jgi:ribosome-binding factor A
MAAGTRPRRVAEAIRAHLTSVLGRELADPHLTGVVITGVELTADLGIARVGVRLLGETDGAAGKRVVGRLERAQGRLRRGLGQAVPLKRLPELRFHFDDGPDARARVDELLAEIAREPKPDD